MSWYTVQFARTGVWNMPWYTVQCAGTGVQNVLWNTLQCARTGVQNMPTVCLHSTVCQNRCVEYTPVTQYNVPEQVCRICPGTQYNVPEQVC